MSVDEFEVTIPDVPEGLLGFRVWRVDEPNLRLYSVVMGDLPRARTPLQRLLLANAPADDGGWPTDEPLTANCPNRKHKAPDPEHTCGIYAATDLERIAGYIREAPVLGLVRTSGTVVPAEWGWRAEQVVIEALFALADEFTVKRRVLDGLADAYGVPVIRPHSTKPDDYRFGVRSGFASGWEWDFEEKAA